MLGATIVLFVLALFTGTVPTVHGILLIALLISFVLWLATIVDERRAKAAPPLAFQQKRNPTAEDISMEEALLHQAAQQEASEAAARQIRAIPIPDEADHLMIVGVAIDPERYQRPPVLQQRIVARERWTRIALAIFGGLGGGRP
jgi:hypothetical protein